MVERRGAVTRGRRRPKSRKSPSKYKGNAHKIKHRRRYFEDPLENTNVIQMKSKRRRRDFGNPLQNSNKIHVELRRAGEERKPTSKY